MSEGWPRARSPTRRREIFQEGLRLPAVKLIEAGRPNQSVMEIMKVNSRLPDFLVGDMWAGVAAARVGERRILDLVAKYGRETFVLAMDTFMDHGEQVALRALQELPHGRFEIAEEQDSGVVYPAVDRDHRRRVRGRPPRRS